MIEIILHPQWLDNATAGLSETLRGDLPSLKQQVNNRVAQLWEINTDNGKSWMVSRVEYFDYKPAELVICCYKGCDLKQVTQLVHDSAQAQGIGSIRYHTQRKGLNRLVVDLGFTPYETVYKKYLQEA